MINGIITFIIGLSLPTIFLNLFGFALLERWIPAEQNQTLRSYLLNLRITALYLIITNYYWGNISASIVAKLTAKYGSGLFNLSFETDNIIILQIISGILMAIIADFFYYWFHRLQHHIPALWSQHKIHHLDEHVNASTSNRHHWLEELFRIPFLAVPLAILFKFNPLPAGIIAFLFTSWGYFIHANLRIELGPLTPFIGGPQVHRIHHSRFTKHYNKNFAAFFPTWDIIFGTYYHPQPGEFPPTGIVNEKMSTLKDAALLPIYEWVYSIKTYLKISYFNKTPEN